MAKRRPVASRTRRRTTNPYFRIKAKKLTPVRVVLGSVFVLVVTLGSLIIFKPWLHIADLNISGAKEDTTEQVRAITESYLDKKILFTLPRRHAWLLAPGKLEAQLLDGAPLNAVRFKRERHTLNIELSEKIRTFYLEHGDVIYAVDRTGIVLGPIPDVERIRIELGEAPDQGVPLIKDRRTVGIVEGEVGLSAERLEGIVGLIDLIESSTLLSTLSVEISDEEGRVDVLTDAGVALYVTFDRSLEDQIGKLETLIERKLIDINELGYIDLRFENRLFYH